jgi:hypothetical protein
MPARLRRWEREITGGLARPLIATGRSQAQT